MATVVVCDRCGAKLPDEADATLVLTTATERFDLCPTCFDDLRQFVAGMALDPAGSRVDRS